MHSFVAAMLAAASAASAAAEYEYCVRTGPQGGHCVKHGIETTLFAVPWRTLDIVTTGQANEEDVERVLHCSLPRLVSRAGSFKKLCSTNANQSLALVKAHCYAAMADNVMRGKIDAALIDGAAAAATAPAVDAHENSVFKAVCSTDVYAKNI